MLLLSLALLLPVCWTQKPAEAPAAHLDKELAMQALDAPGGEEGARYPRWARGGDGRLRVTWTAPVEGSADSEPVHAVRFARLDAGRFSDAVELERGPGHFVNWADAPLVTAFGDGTPVGAWLSVSDAGPYAYGVRVRAAGETRWLHDDRSPGEHGFVSLEPHPAGGVDAVWLDGRATVGEGGHEHGAGAMALTTRRIGADGALGPEVALDERVCDCCQTSAARLADGTLVVAYRDRGDDERRDISFVKLAPGAQEPTAPRPVAVDGWVIQGCPVNGPELVARGARVACVWYTEKPSPRVQLALSEAGADAFAPPVRVDAEGSAGRASLAWLEDGSLLVAYLVETDVSAERGEWRVRRFVDGGSDAAHGGVPLVLASVSTSRQSGFLRLAADGAGAVAAWTDVDDGYRLRAARISVAR